MPYVDFELLKKERLSTRAREDSIEVNRERGAELRLNYSSDLTLKEGGRSLSLSVALLSRTVARSHLLKLPTTLRSASRRWWPWQEMLEDLTLPTAHIVTELNE